MIRTQHITVGDYNCYVHRDHAFNDQHSVAYSHLLVCPKCQTIWAKLHFVEDHLCWAEAAFCGNCNEKDSWHPVPGSILLEESWGQIDDSLLAALPPELLLREFNLHIKAYS